MNFKKSDKIKSRRNNLEERSENIIENVRLSKGISQRELAKLLGISGSILNGLLMNWKMWNINMIMLNYQKTCRRF